MAETRNSRKVRTGVVVSISGEKSCTVQINNRKRHPKYGKMMTVSKKPAETRMGKGKGNPEEWVAVVKPGRVMFEIDGVDEEVAREALRLAQHKLPIKTKILSRADQEEEA